ncbi:MAG: hypothetical protein MJ198_05075 [Bacteroidales bacterium]|nr:hypothetical protein [Bacteroidales bacterium]
MGKKLTKGQLKKITFLAKDIRKKSGVKSKKTQTVYNKKWTDCIKQASKQLGYSKK